VSAPPRARVTKSRKLAARALDIDDRGRVVGIVPATSSIAMAGPDDPSAQLKRKGPGLYPDKGDLDTVARWIADVALVPIEVVLAVFRTLEGLPVFLLVGYVLYTVTNREFQRGRR
jgi:hypothetical protein